MSVTIEIARNAGACYGVKRALRMAREASSEPAPVHTLGPLIHNPRVVEALSASGVGVANDLDEASDGTLILRSHGTAPQIVEEARRRGFNVIDATCPYVSKVQREARKLADEGYGVIIIGEPGHAEVEGIRAWGGDAVVAVTDDPSMLPDSLPSKVGVVIQTTQSTEHVDAVLEALTGRVDELRVESTVCLATQERQSAAKELASSVDLMIVIGGKNSGNTRRLFEICNAQCPSTHHIESTEEIRASWLEGVSSIGVTAGASTPQEHIDDVVSCLEGMVIEQGASL